MIPVNDVLNIKTDLGTSINNIGPKVSYTDLNTKDFIPTILKLGFLLNPELHVNPEIDINVALYYQMDKLLVPTPPIYEIVDGRLTGNITKGMNPDVSNFKGMIQSFYDAPYGFDEEMNEINHKLGCELRVNYRDNIYFALRGGRFNENKYKGNRNFYTKGLGIGVFGFSVDYGFHTLNSIDEQLISLSYSFNLKNIYKR